METYADDPSELKDVPTGMETDPEADEQVIDQTDDGLTNDQPAEVNPSGIEKPKAGEETAIDDLANALAHAIDGSGMGLAGAPPVAPSVGTPQKIATEGTTGAGLTDEEK
ncbi:hypothetical protein J2I47_01705 [Fibrella sp. HMF5335]|uniref:Uncharacterized protein n=1 Tax=Fibrella rubiginis TaxID=2817060 RepID=A0A939GF25_9BACT|nr:hypothetical protein [Fibrella rubiginis]MBO0935253.1 hypothetical protein [Fibrella rubiginis]